MPKSTTTCKRWYSQREAAEYLSVTDRTVRDYIARGILPASRVRNTRTIRINIADLESLLTPIPSAVGGGERLG